MRVVAVANHKGGCGKTTTSIHFAACLAHLDKRVLLIDLDPQGHSTCGLGVRAEDLPVTLYDLLHQDDDLKSFDPQVLYHVNPNLDLIPSYGILSAIEEEFVQHEGRNYLLQKRIAEIAAKAGTFDYVILDCPPNLGLLTTNALEAADEVIIPIEPSFFSLHGLAKMMDTLDQVNSRRAEPIVLHALLTLFDTRTSFAEEVYEEVKRHFSDRLLKAIIHENVLFKEAAGAGQSIVEFRPKSDAFRDYLNLAVEFLERDWSRLLPEKKLGWKNVWRNRFGPRRTTDGVLFQFVSENARDVEIVGDFNQWVPLTMRKTDENLWQRVILAPSGEYRYKYIVDGEWQLDPYQSEQSNSFGGWDSYYEMS